MLNFLRRLGGMRTLRQLCERAEAHARRRGEPEPGAEHFLLAAFDLPDGAAARVFARLHADPAGVERAIEEQYRNALVGVGSAVAGAETGSGATEATEADDPAASLPGAPLGLYRAKASGQALVQMLARDPALQRGRLSGAHVLAALARAEQGVAARTLRVLGIDRHQLMQAADAEIASMA